MNQLMYYKDFDFDSIKTMWDKSKIFRHIQFQNNSDKNIKELITMWPGYKHPTGFFLVTIIKFFSFESLLILTKISDCN